MPGLRYPGPPTTGGYSFFHDVPSPSAKDGAPWDAVDIASVHSRLNKPKACRPTWMKAKPSAFMSTSAPAQGNGGNDSDDLAAMVHDFIESGSPASLLPATDPDTKPPNPLQLRDTLQTLTSSYGGIEAELVSAVRKLVLAIDVDNDLICNADCRGGCIKRLVVHQLRAAGYDAAVCTSKWESSGRVLGGAVHMGEYEYIDVEVYWDHAVERLIVDVDFQDQFVLARATPSYLASLKALPTVFVGTTKRLEQVLQIMAEAVKVSLKQNAMPVPPWRTLEFMTSKWLSPRERQQFNWWPVRAAPGRLASMPETRQCDVQLRRIKDTLLSEVNDSRKKILGRGRTRQTTCESSSWIS